MQDSDPSLPGYYKRPTPKDKNSFSNADDGLLANSDEFSVIEDELVNELSDESDSDEEMEEFSDFVEFDLGSDWEDDATLKKSAKDKTSKFDRKSRLEDELTSASLEEFDSDKDILDLVEMGNGVEKNSKFDEAEISESEKEKNIGKRTKRSKKLSSQMKFGFKSTGKIFSSLDQFLEEEESDPSSDSGIDEEIDEFTDFDEEDTDWDKDWDELDEKEKRRREMDGFAPPGVGYGNITEEFLKKIKKEKISKSEKKRRLREEAKRAKQEAGMVTVCARCHSLRNYGQIKNPNVENLIPDFDFDRFISTRLMKSTGTASVVVMVVDCTDFDGSFPKVAAKSLFKTLEGTRSKSNKLPKLILVATKIDLLPSQISPARLDKWVRSRAKANGAHKLDAVYQVSSHKDLNIRNLVSCIKQSAGPRGNVWVVGAQNAGKSTLINVFAKKQGVKITKLTEAAVPGTTLGILRVTGILPAKVKMFDTPGLLHPGLLMNRLNRDEQKMVEFRKGLKPRSFRIKASSLSSVLSFFIYIFLLN
jgi:GTPase Era involved in 16S rRNA processing